MNVFPVIAHFQDAALEARAAAFFADELNVREKLHFHGDGAVALTGFAATAGHVEGKMAGSVAAALGVGRVRKHFANGVEGFQVSGRVRTGRAADGRLVYDHHFADVGIAVEAVAKFLDAAAHALGGQSLVQNVMNQRGFAGAAYAGNHGESAERNQHIEILQIVQVRAEETQKSSGGLMALVGNRDAQFAIEIAARKRSRFLENCVVGTGEEQLAYDAILQEPRSLQRQGRGR